MKQKLRSRGLLPALFVLALPCACKRDEPRLATPPPVLGPASAGGTARGLPPGHPPLAGGEALPAGHPPVAGQGTAVPAPGAVTGELAWELPKGWAQTRGDGMRLATLKPPAAGVDVSIVVLPGPAGGELGNVNRWRGQIGLAAIDEPARVQARTAVRAQAGEVSLYDFTGAAGQPQRMVAGLLVVGGKTWFFKMTGDPAAVGGTKAEFLKFLESLRAT